jgi:hypothetical protein
MGITTDTLQFKLGDGVTTWNSLQFQNLPNSVMSTAVYSAKGSIAAASAVGVPVNVSVGANNAILVADSTQVAGVKWTAAPAGLTLTTATLTAPTVTAPAITGATTIGAGSTITTPAIVTPTITAGGTWAGGTLTNPLITGPTETWNISATVATGTVNVDVVTSTNWYYTSNASANWTFNFRGNGATTLATTLAVGQSVTVGFLVTNGASAFLPTAFTIDGSAVTPKWQGNVAPSAGNINGIDAYLFTIVKTAATPTYTIFASQTKFA